MKQDLAQLLGSIIQTSIINLNELPESEVSSKRDINKWSKKEILGHLIDSGLNNHRRFKQSINQTHLVFDGYNQDQEVKAHNYQSREWAKIVSLWSGINEQIVNLILSFDEVLLTSSTLQHNFDKIGFKRVVSTEESSLAYLILDYIGHLEHHLSQLIPHYVKRLAGYENSPLGYTETET